jgi:hypothetical protein
MKVTKYSLGLVAVLLALTETIFADEIGTTYADLNWAAAHFSGPVLPFAPPPTFFPSSTVVQAFNLTTNEATTVANEPTGWGTSTSKLQFGPRDYGQASADGLLTTFSSTTRNYVIDADVTRAGLIQSVDGTISIDIPYSFTVTTAAGFTATPRFLIFLFSPDGDVIGESLMSQTYQGNGIDISKSGVFSAQSFASNLQIGTYYGFFVDVNAETVHTDEPSTSLLLAFSLVCLGCLSFWKRFAQYRHALIMN